MGNITPTILVPIDTSAGATAINYSPGASGCPILAVHCAGASGSGDVKITPYRATEAVIYGDGSGARIRLACDAIGQIITAEIASGGSGYADGPVPVILIDPNGTNGLIACTASSGVVSSVSIVSPGIDYSGYITFDVGDFVEGVTYDFVPRYIENTGNGTVKLFGHKLAFRPFQVF